MREPGLRYQPRWRLVRFLAVAVSATVLLGLVPVAALASVPTSAKRNGCDDFYQPWDMYISVLNAPPGRKMVIGIDRASMDTRKDAILADYDPNAKNQKWSYRLCFLGGNEYIQLKNEKSQKCLDKSEDTPNANGNRVYQYPCGGITYPYDPPTNNQLWQRRPGPGTSGKWMQLFNRAAGRCLDIRNEAYVNGAFLTVWDCDPGGSSTQQWNAFR